MSCFDVLLANLCAADDCVKANFKQLIIKLIKIVDDNVAVNGKPLILIYLKNCCLVDTAIVKAFAERGFDFAVKDADGKSILQWLVKLYAVHNVLVYGKQFP